MGGLLFIRNTLQLSQTQLARVLGLTRALVDAMETGRRPMTVYKLLPITQFSHLAESALEQPPAVFALPDKAVLEKELRLVDRNIKNLQHRLDQQTEGWTAHEQLMQRLRHVAENIKRKTELDAAAFEQVKERKANSYKGWKATEIALAKARLAGWRAQEAVLMQALQDA